MPSRQPATAAGSFPDLSASVGERIRDLRARRGMSLSALAETTRLGKGTLSELERGQRNPTLDTLFAISTALSVPLGDLLVTAAPRVHGQSIDAELLGQWEDSTEVVEVYRMTVSRGRRESRAHAPGVVESVTVVSGEVVVGTRDAPARLLGGQSHTFAGDEDHVYEGVAELSTTVLVMRYPRDALGSLP